MNEYNEMHRDMDIVLREENGEWSCSVDILKDMEDKVYKIPVLRGGFGSREAALDYARTAIDIAMSI